MHRYSIAIQFIHTTNIHMRAVCITFSLGYFPLTIDNALSQSDIIIQKVGVSPNKNLVRAESSVEHGFLDANEKVRTEKVGLL